MSDTDLAELNDATLEKAEELQRSTTRKAALAHAPAAIEMMAKISKGHQIPGKQRPSPTVVLKACEGVLHQAHGRPETRDGRTGQAEAGLTVIVNHLSTGSQELVMGDEDQMKSINSVGDALRIANTIQAHKDRQK